MKELYIAPEVKLIGFVSAEKMASLNGELDLDTLPVTMSNGLISGMEGDIKIKL